LVPQKKIPVLLPNGETKVDDPPKKRKKRNTGKTVENQSPPQFIISDASLDPVKFRGANSMYNKPVRQ
jgi:hypothetical protein